MVKRTSSTKAARLAEGNASKAAAAKPRLEVSIDYPQEGEIVRPGHYSVRITAAGAGQVQARVGEGEWRDCRESAGHFWHDWAPESGPVRIAARARVGKGRWSLSGERCCVVVG